MFITAYGTKQRVSLDFLDADGVPIPTMTQQQHKRECDIGYIINQYDKTGLIQHVNRAVATYGDYSEVNEYQESLNVVLAAQAAFGELPANIRKRFGNDPGEFFEFASNPANSDELVSLGLAEPKPPVFEEVTAPDAAE